MLLGIDVGGTHTDGVAIDTANGAEVVASCKVVTRHDDLLSSVTGALEAMLDKVDRAAVTQLNLSTTLSTNAIVQGKTEDVGVIVSAGPGIDPHNSMLCKDFHVIDGSIDHRGNEVRALSTHQLTRAIDACRENGIRVFAAVGKFSTRNPRHENVIRRTICKCRDCASARTRTSFRWATSSGRRSISPEGWPRPISIARCGGCIMNLPRRWRIRSWTWGCRTSR